MGEGQMKKIKEYIDKKPLAFDKKRTEEVIASIKALNNVVTTKRTEENYWLERAVSQLKYVIQVQEGIVLYSEIKEQANETYRNKIIEVIKQLNDTRNLMSVYCFAEAKIKFEQNK